MIDIYTYDFDATYWLDMVTHLNNVFTPEHVDTDLISVALCIGYLK